jgi:uncharacterized membrane protein
VTGSQYELSPAISVSCAASGLQFRHVEGIGHLPENVAIHFDGNGTPDGWATRDQYRVLIMASLLGMPLLLVSIMAGLPRLTKGKGQIPDGEYWFADERRRVTTSFLLTHACWLGCMTAAAIYGIHIFVTRANAVIPPMLATSRLITMILVFLCGLAWWTPRLIKRFQRTESQ